MRNSSRMGILLLITLLAGVCATSFAQTAPDSMFQPFRVEDPDRSLSRYWEERLLLQPRLYMYANMLPRISPPQEDWHQPAHPVDSLLRERIYNYENTNNFILNRWGLFNSSGKKGVRLATRFIPFVEELAASDTLPVHRIGINSEAWVIPTNDLQIYLRMRLENHGILYPNFKGRDWKEKITGWVDNAALYYKKGPFFVSAGRSAMIIGPEVNDALLLSNHAPQLDRIWLGYEHPVVRFDYFMTKLDSYKLDSDSLLVRYLVGHRLSFHKRGSFEFGLSEIVLFGGFHREIEWRYINPFVPYYWEQWNRGGDDNIMFGLDFSIYWPKRSRIFGELMIDDFQIDFRSEPHQVAYKLGLDMVEPFGVPKTFTKLSYTRVNTTVYGQNQPQNLYVYYFEPLGYFGGNDQDRFLALARHHFSSSLDAELEFQYTRKGEGVIEKHERSGVPFEDKFPIGIVEKSPSIRASLLWFHRGLMEARLNAQFSHFDNYRHICGSSENAFDFGLKVAYNLQGIVD